MDNKASVPLELFSHLLIAYIWTKIIEEDSALAWRAALESKGGRLYAGTPGSNAANAHFSSVSLIDNEVKELSKKFDVILSLMRDASQGFKTKIKLSIRINSKEQEVICFVNSEKFLDHRKFGSDWCSCLICEYEEKEKAFAFKTILKIETLL